MSRKQILKDSKEYTVGWTPYPLHSTSAVLSGEVHALRSSDSMAAGKLKIHGVPAVGHQRAHFVIDDIMAYAGFEGIGVGSLFIQYLLGLRAADHTSLSTWTITTRVDLSHPGKKALFDRNGFKLTGTRDSTEYDMMRGGSANGQPFILGPL